MKSRFGFCASSVCERQTRTDCVMKCLDSPKIRAAARHLKVLPTGRAKQTAAWLFTHHVPVGADIETGRRKKSAKIKQNRAPC